MITAQDFKKVSLSKLRTLTSNDIASSTQFYCIDSGKEGLWYYDPSDTSTVDDGAMCVVSGTYRFKRSYNESVNARWFGVIGDGVTDYTIQLQNAIDFLYNNGGGEVKLKRGIYRCRELNLKTGVSLNGETWENCRLRFISSGDIITDSTSYTLKWTGSYNKLSNLAIDGFINSTTYSIGNGLNLIPDSSGLEKRIIENVRIGLFSGYKINASGGTYGVNKNYSRSDISDGNGNHLLIGGNAFIITKNSNPAWGLTINNLSIFTVDGQGCNLGGVSDSKFQNIDIGGCVSEALVFDQNNKNLEFNNVKVYLSRMLNVQDTYEQKLDLIAPHEISISTEFSAAVVMTGANHNISNFEVQECGSHGISLGTNKYSLSSSNLYVTVDGNGGYDSNADLTTQSNYRRYGIIAKNYFAINLKGTADDFRVKFLLPRQSRGIHVISDSSRPKFYFSGSLIQDNYYKIIDNSGGADFTPLQLGYSTTSNNIGTVFQARSNYQTALPNANFGTGYLGAVNDYSNIDMVIINQHEQNQNISNGYNIDYDGGNSNIIINGTKSYNKNVESYKSKITTNTLFVKNDFDSPNGIELQGNNTGNSSRLFFSSKDDLENGFGIRKGGTSLIFSTNSIAGQTSGVSRWLLTLAGTFSPALDKIVNIGSSSLRVLNAYFNTIYTNIISSQSGDALILQSQSTNSIIFAPNLTTRAQLFNSGNFYLGNTPVDTGDKLYVDGTISINNKIKFSTGVNKPFGNSTLVDGTVTIPNTLAINGSLIIIQRTILGGTTGTIYYTINNGVGFTVNSTSNTETSSFTYLIIN